MPWRVSLLLYHLKLPNSVCKHQSDEAIVWKLDQKNYVNRLWLQSYYSPTNAFLLSYLLLLFVFCINQLTNESIYNLFNDNNRNVIGTS